jgi:hypothetical protein
MAHTYDPHADDLVTMLAAEPAPPGEDIPPPVHYVIDTVIGAGALPPLEDPPDALADLAQIADNLGLTPDEAAQRLNSNPLVDLRDARDVLEAAVATEIASYGLQALTAGAIRAIARAAVSRQLELVDDVLNRPAVDVRTRLTADETGWL